MGVCWHIIILSQKKICRLLLHPKENQAAGMPGKWDRQPTEEKIPPSAACSDTLSRSHDCVDIGGGG